MLFTVSRGKIQTISKLIFRSAYYPDNFKIFNFCIELRLWQRSFKTDYKILVSLTYFN